MVYGESILTEKELNSMEKEIIERWEKGKENLQKYLSTHKIENTCESYEDLVKVLINQCLNYSKDYPIFSTEFVCIDNGDYQGTQIFVLHYNTYQPNASDYYIFDNDYGSCSGCDTLLGIIGYGSTDGFPNEDMVNKLITLCLHMVQRMKCIDNLWNE